MFDFILHKADKVTRVELNQQMPTFRAVTTLSYEAEWQLFEKIDMTISTGTPLSFGIGDWIIFGGKKYHVYTNYTSSEVVSDGKYVYNVTFYGPYRLFKKANMYNTSQIADLYVPGGYRWERVDNETVSNGDIVSLGNQLCYNLNASQEKMIIKLGDVPAELVGVFKEFTFSDPNCLVCLHEICEVLGTFYRIRVNELGDTEYILDFGYDPGYFPVTLKYGKKQGLYQLSLTNSDEEVHTIFVVRGSSDNLPSHYPKFRLSLDDSYQDSTIFLPEKYAKWGRSVKELTYDDIKPERTGEVTGLVPGNINAFVDDTLTFNPVGGTIKFLSGRMIGHELECISYNSDTHVLKLKPYEDANRFVIPSPDSEAYRISVGDKYNIDGIGLPDSYVTDAEGRLLAESEKDVEYFSQVRATYNVLIEQELIKEEGVAPEIGMFVHIEHEDLDIDKFLRIKRISMNILGNYPVYNAFEVSDLDYQRADILLYKNTLKAHLIAKKNKKSADNAITSVKDYAEEKASDALIAANAANNLLADIANDDKLTAEEKQAVKKEWDIIVSEKTKIDTQADLFSVSKTAYGVAYTSLSDYIVPLLADLNVTSDIEGPVFREKFKDYYDERTDILNAIAAKARSLANAAQSTANSAASAASAAATTAGAAQTAAIAANNLLADIANDDKFTPDEKHATKKEWDTIVSEKPKIDAQADLFGVAKANYGSAYSSLSSYITPLLENMSVTSDILGVTFRATFKGYYDVRTDILNAIAGKARDLANAAQGTANTALDNAASAYGLASAAQSAANDAGMAVGSLSTYVDGAFKDGVISESEAVAIEKYINLVSETKAQVDASFTKLYANDYLSGVAKDNLNTAKSGFNTATTELLQAIEDAIDDGQVTELEKAAVDTKYIAFSVALGLFQSRVEDANVAIQAAILIAAEEEAAALDEKIRIAVDNLFSYIRLGVYDSGDINTDVTPIRLTSSGGFRGKSVLFVDGYVRDYVVDDAKITVSNKLVGCLIDINDRKELMVYGKTSLGTLTVKYKIDGGAEVVKSESVTDGRFSFVLSDLSGSVLSLGLGGSGNFTLEEVMVIHGTKVIDFKFSEYDLLVESVTQAEATTDWAVQLVLELYSKMIGFEGGWDEMVELAKAGKSLIIGGYINTLLLKARTIVAEHIAAGTITAKEIRDATITGAKIKGGEITGTHIADSTITKANIVDATITADKIDVEDLAANNAFIDELTVEFLETVKDVYGYKVIVDNSNPSMIETSASRVLVTDEQGNFAEIAYSAQDDMPIVKLVSDLKDCNLKLLPFGLFSQSKADSPLGYDGYCLVTPNGISVNTGTEAANTQRLALIWDNSRNNVVIYNDLLPWLKASAGTKELYRDSDGLNNPIIRHNQ